MLKHTQQLERIAEGLERLSLAMETMAAVADRAERTLLGPARALAARLGGNRNEHDG